MQPPWLDKKNDFGPPEGCPDLAAAVGVAAILAGQREVPQVVESNPAAVGRHQNLAKKMEWVANNFKPVWK